MCVLCSVIRSCKDNYCNNLVSTIRSLYIVELILNFTTAYDKVTKTENNYAHFTVICINRATCESNTCHSCHTAA